jgi:hypothetical protein
MRVCLRVIGLCSYAIAVVSVALAGTTFVRRWKSTEGSPPTLQKILAFALTENYIIRQHFEDEMEVQLALRYQLIGHSWRHHK